ncbi:uncharacterized protein LOC120723181 [Xyrichtys novacula]|uniref:Gypsy retrotransposon integrase-like protein 1 n=1 Tax=Xyrichtys novacula TaxID=13765 RepID=A0AAV1FU73_XYRNO|nr:uncharacterized protein LOC120723181 [Xyrichtys novacula]
MVTAALRVNSYKWCQKWDVDLIKEAKMTRGGKRDERREEPEEGPAPSAADEGAMASSGGNQLEELTSMMKSFMQTQAVRDKQQEKEHSRQELRWRNMEHQFRQIQAQVTEMREEQQQEQAGGEEQRASGVRYEEDQGEMDRSGHRIVRLQRGLHTHPEPKLLPLSPEDDVEHFLATFERMAHVCHWPQDEWAVRLIPLLTGKARSAYVLMDIDSSDDYERVKEAILAKYEINAETYRRRFRALDVHQGETPRELYVRLKEMFNKWVKPETTTVKDISELLIMEQFLRMVNPEMEVWIREHDPKTAEEAARLAEVFQSARRGHPRLATNHSNSPGVRNKSFGGDRGHGQTQGRFPGNKQNAQSRPVHANKPAKSDVRCYHCNELGHTQYTCPAAGRSKLSLLCSVPRPTMQEPGTQESGRKVPVLINGQREEALVDSGSFQTVVRASLVPREQWADEKADIGCVHGDVRPYPTAEVYLTVGGQTFLLSVALVPQLPYPVILGLDVPTLLDLVQDPQKQSPLPTVCDEVLEIPGEPEPLQVKSGENSGTEVKECHVVTRAQSARNTLSELPFYEAELEVGVEKLRRSRVQKRRDTFLGAPREKDEIPQPSPPLDVDIPLNVGELQRKDPTLQRWFQKVSKVDGVSQGSAGCLEEVTYMIEKGILYQCQGSTQALAAPQSLRHTIMELGHSIPWAGHMAFHKTLRRVSNRFVWPGMYTQLSKFCNSCSICQVTAGKGVTKALLQPLPLIETPFERIGMDVVGPLEKSASGNRYILVMCDYATRYPEAFLLRSVKARHVANCLLQLFSRVGIAKEILTDCGTNFLSKLLRQVYQLLGVKGIKTTPYHPQTDGLVERYNQTLKNMLRKFVSQTGSDWDQWLPYLLFAYREVPQASTGFSPFELLYGRQVRGPLDLLRDYWEDPKASGESIVAYVVKMRERLEKMATLAKENMTMAQEKQKTWYDQKARERVFQPGQKVLLLLPSSESKLLAKWQGPYEVTKKVGAVSYEIHMPDRAKKHQTFHINLLKEFHDCPEPVSQHFFIQAAEEKEVEEQFFPTSPAGVSQVEVAHLTPDQQKGVEALLDPELFQEKPGFTDLVQHSIHLKETAPSRKRSYRIPERLVPELKKEIQLMLELGIIEVSDSEWCSPVVLVPKKDGSLRFCIDFRYLNAISKFDPYPMPRIDELLERVGKAKYISTLDLSKGYWQVALAPEAKKLTAFATPYGLFHFRVMPFGLQGAPATFQRLMDQVLREVSAFSAAYLDDVVVYSQTWEEHMAHLTRVLHCIKAAGLTINPRKCIFAQKEVEYLGYIIGDGVIRPQVSKLEAITSYPVPTTKKKVKSFLGLVGWYRKFIPHLSERAAVLTDLTKASASAKVRWTEKCEEAFRDLKQAISVESVLQSPDFDRPFTLQTDASGVGIGAVLLQEVEGEMKPVLFLSRKLAGSRDPLLHN